MKLLSMLVRSAALALSVACVGCMALSELAYDSKVGMDRQSCAKLPDMAAYRQCLEQVRAVEKQAEKVRSGG
jgi:uncharacterized metal-binding protein